MKKNVFVNNLKIIGISVALSLFYWWITNRELLFRKPDYNLFREVNASIYGYSSLQSYFLVYLVPFFVLLNSFIKNEKDYRTVRLKNRKEIACNRIKMLIKTVQIVFIPHFFLQILTNAVLFLKTQFIDFGFFIVEILQIINVSIVFFILGLCFENLILYLKREIALFSVIVLSILYYFINRICLDYLLLREMCIKDLIISETYTVNEFVISVIKNITVIFIAIQLIIVRLKESDVYEK